jgi:HSP20 family molecular chaperone IbpA
MKFWKKKSTSIYEPTILHEQDAIRYVLPMMHVQPESLRVMIDSPKLTVRASRMMPPEHDGSYRERSLGVAEHTLTLPEHALADQVTARVETYSVAVRVPVRAG